jgi:hypothetical protein
MKVLSVAAVSFIYLQSVSQAVRPIRRFVNKEEGNDYIRTRQLRADETSEASEDAPVVVAPAPVATPVTTMSMSHEPSMSMSHSMSMSVPSCAPIYDIGKSDPNFSTLISLIDLAQLAVVLGGPEELTVLGK